MAVENDEEFQGFAVSQDFDEDLLSRSFRGNQPDEIRDRLDPLTVKADDNVVDLQPRPQGRLTRGGFSNSATLRMVFAANAQSRAIAAVAAAQTSANASGSHSSS